MVFYASILIPPKHIGVISFLALILSSDRLRERRQILVVLMIIPALIVVGLILGCVLEGLLDCYEDYRFRIKKD